MEHAMIEDAIPEQLIKFIASLEANKCWVERDGDRNRWTAWVNLRWQDSDGNITPRPFILGTFGFFTRDGRAVINGTGRVAENLRLRKRQIA